MPKFLKKNQKKVKTVLKTKSNTCTICLEQCKKPTKLLNKYSEISCSHEFCHDCIIKWTKNTCPNCRKKFIKIKCGSSIERVEIPSFVEAMLGENDIPNILKETINMLVMSEHTRKEFLKGFLLNLPEIHHLWDFIDPIIMLIELNHASVCDIPLHSHFPEFIFLIKMLRRFKRTIF